MEVLPRGISLVKNNKKSFQAVEVSTKNDRGFI